MTDYIANFELNQNNIDADFSLGNTEFDALFEINPAGANWGSITGHIENQTDLYNILNAKADITALNQVSSNLTALTVTVGDNYTVLDGRISALSTTVSDNYSTLDNRLDTAEGSILNLTDTVSDNYTELNGKITTNADNITSIYNTMDNYGDIVTYNAADFATKNQGLLAESALQPNNNITLLNNNAGYITNAVNNLANYYLKSETYTKTEVQQLIASIPQFSVVVVQTLPVTGERMVLYLVPKEGASPDVYNEYIWIEADEDYELIGNTAIDLTDYVQFTDLATVATTGDYDDLIDKPIPPVGYGTSSSLAATATKVVSIPEITELKVGQVIIVKPSTTSTVANSKIKLNDFEAYNMRYNNANITTSTDSIVWTANVASMFIFDGTYWQFLGHGLDNNTNTTYASMSVDEGITGTATAMRSLTATNLKQIIQGTKLKGLVTTDDADVVASDSITIGIGKLQAQSTETKSILNDKQDTLVSGTNIKTINNESLLGSGNITIQGGGAVDSVNGQTGTVVLTASDVGALADTTTIPSKTSDLTNDSGFITGITSSDVTTALGYTPYNSTNPDGYITSSALNGYATETWVGQQGYITGITSSDVVTALTYTPYNGATNPNGYITSADLPTNYVTTDTAQDISGRKTFLGEKAIYFKQLTTANKLGFTLYNPSNTELGALEYRPSTIGSASLLALNCPQTTGGYVGFRYWGTPAVNIVAPKVATAGNYFIPTHITNGSTTVTANNTGTVNISTLLPDVSNFVTNSSLATTLEGYAETSDIPTAISDLIDDTSTNPIDKAESVADQRDSSSLKYWTGTKAQYDAIVTKDSDTIYNVEDTTSPIIDILNTLYPIGAIYIGTMATCPLSVLGIGTWQLVAQDRVLQGAGTRGTVGSEIDESLPNITGSGWNLGGASNSDWTGAFNTNVTTRFNLSSGTANGGGSLTFDASRSSATYQDNAPVQQDGYLVNIWERVA